jgi:NTE family protein
MIMAETPPIPDVRKRKTAFVFSGGITLGSVQVGMAKALFEYGCFPDFCVGSSVGAINAAYICGNPTLEGICELEKIWLTVRQKDIFPVGLLGSIIRIIRKKNFLVSSRGLRNLLARHMRYHTLADAVIPCLLITTDILTGEQVVLTSGNVIEAVMASTALPGVYPPVEIAGRLLIDGGISSNTPLSVAAEYAAGEIVVLPAGYPNMLEKAPADIIGLFSHSLNILIGQQFLRDIEIYRKDIRIHILPPFLPDKKPIYDLSRTGEFLSQSYQNTKQWLESGGMESFTIPGRAIKPNQWL